MNDDDLLAEYRTRYLTILKPLAERLTVHLQDHLLDVPRIDRVAARAKSPERFLGKTKKRSEDGALKYEHPFEQIQDLVGARVIVFYKQDVDVVSAIIERYFRKIEAKDLIPDSVNEFGYVGKHWGCKNFCVNGQLAGNCCTPMELQLNDRHERTDRQPAG